MGVRDRKQRGQLPPPQLKLRKPWKFGQMLKIIKSTRADLSENMLNSGYFITILLNCPPRKDQPPTPMARMMI